MSDAVPLEPSDFESFLGDVSSNGSGLFEEVGEQVQAPPEDMPGPFDQDKEPIKLGDGECVVCGEPTFRPPGLTPTGRKKRAPKYCSLHDPRVNQQTRDEPVYNLRELEAQLKKIQVELADDVMLFGTLTGPLFPVTGYYIVDNADQFTVALLKLCKNNVRMMRLLHRAAQVAPIYQVARFGAGVGIAVQVDQQKHDPHSVMAQRLGVTHAFNAVHTKSDSVPSSMGNNNFTGPPHYATVQ